MNLADCRRILQVPPDAGLDEVKAAFRKHAFRLHPDLNPSPRAAEDFRRLNEAYILLSRSLEAEAQAGFTRPGPSARGSTGSGTGTGPSEGPDVKARQAKAGKAYAKTAAEGRAQASGKAKAGGFRYKEEEVLRDLLADPFARQVFEDIYSQLKRGEHARPAQFGPGAPLNPEPPKRKRLEIRWGEKSVGLDMSKGLVGGVKSWLSTRLDDEQTVHYPAHALGPGKSVRLTLSTRFGAPRTIEITLPPDFVVGRPIRLKGLGLKLGPFTGDLYLRVLAK